MRAVKGVLVVDDHHLVRGLLVDKLTELYGIGAVREAGSGEEALREVQRHKPGLVFMDLAMPGIGGIRATKRIHTRHPETRVIVLTAYDHWLYIRHALDAGAAGFVPKDATFEELIEQMRKVEAGQRGIQKRMLEQMIREDDPRVREANPFHRLSGREFEVLWAILAGRGNKDIAKMLNVSPKTVSSHRTQIHRKVGADSHAELIRLALRFGLLQELALA